MKDNKSKKIAIIAGAAIGIGAALAAATFVAVKKIQKELSSLNFSDDVDWFCMDCKGNIPLE
jgi:hypothetical protein